MVGLELKLRMGMQLVMTPQLQMAIKLLQMSTLDLSDYLQEELEKNPLLEKTESTEGESSDTSEPVTATQTTAEKDMMTAPDAVPDQPDKIKRA